MENKYFQPPFCVNGNKLCITKFVGGQEKDVPLCNFTARIVEDITVTNGIENERFLGIIGEDENGNPLRKITIPIKSFSQLEWAQEQWNMNCVINAGYGNRDNLRQAIQSTAKYAEPKTVYGTTGWWETKSGWKFCMPGGKNEVKLPEKTKGFSFRTDGDKETTLKAALSLLYSVAPKNIMFPMIAYIVGSVLNTFMVKVGKEPKSVIMLYGKTGSMKTTLSLLLCSFFGRFNEDNIPMSFRDTPKSIIRYCFLLKDCPVLIDDYYPGSKHEQSAQDSATQFLIREICNREARSTLDKSRNQNPAERPQCNAIMTAEYLPNIGESGAARFIPLELKPGDINLDELSEYQRFAEDGTLSHFTYLATEMIKEKYLNKENGEQELVSYLKDTFLQNREFFRDKAREYNFKIRPRLCEDIANLEIGWELYCNTLQYYGVITEDESCYMFKQFVDVIMPLAIQQQSTTETEQPSQIFIRKLGSLIDMGKVSVVERFYSLLEKPRNLIGYSDEDNYYFETDEAFAAVSKACNDVGEHFPLSRKALLKALKNEGISICSKGENTRNVRVSGGTKRLLCIPRSFFEEADDEDTESEDDLPFGPGIIEEAPEQLTV